MISSVLEVNCTYNFSVNGCTFKIHYLYWLSWGILFYNKGTIISWKQSLTQGIIDKVLNVIISLNKKARSCVKSKSGQLIQLFRSLIGVRQGGNLLSLLFAMYISMISKGTSWKLVKDFPLFQISHLNFRLRIRLLILIWSHYCMLMIIWFLHSQRKTCTIH